MQMSSASEEGIAFLEVRNYQAALPNGTGTWTIIDGGQI